MTASAVSTFDDIEFPSEQRRLRLRRPRHIHPRNDLRLKVLAAVTALKGLDAVCFRLIVQQVDHGLLYTTFYNLTLVIYVVYGTMPPEKAFFCTLKPVA